MPPDKSPKQIGVDNTHTNLEDKESKERKDPEKGRRKLSDRNKGGEPLRLWMFIGKSPEREKNWSDRDVLKLYVEERHCTKSSYIRPKSK